MSSTKVASVYPINENGAVILSIDSGSSTPRGYLSEGCIPIDDVTGGMLVAGVGVTTSFLPLTASRNVTPADNGKILYSTSQNPYTLTLVQGMPTNFSVAVLQKNSGQITIATGVGVTAVSVDNFTKTKGTGATFGAQMNTQDEYTLIGQGVT